MHRDRWRRLWAALLALLTALFPGLGRPGGPEEPRPTPPAPTVTVLSGDPGRVTGGDALVEVAAPDGHHHLRVALDGADVTASLTEVAPGVLRGVVDGLPEGESTLTASVGGRGHRHHRHHRHHGGPSASVTLTNHPASGPVFSGPHQQPFSCETEAAGLGPATDEHCSAPTQVVYRYRTTAGGFAELADPAERPADLATVTLDGEELPFIVRLERGVVNRGVYEIAALHDGEEPSPTRDERGWNGKVTMTFGGGCNVGYHQGAATAGVLLPDQLARGFAVASNSLLVNETNCNPVIAAETAMMTKERLTEVYGPITHTIGWGGSGGAIMQYTIAHGYPGIVDGLLPSMSYPDATTNAGPPECVLLLNYLETPEGAGLTPEQRQAIGGHLTFETCNSWRTTFANRIDSTTGCPSIVPADTVYHPETNPDGVRCSIIDHLRTQLGVADDGLPRNPWRNVGVQYGLQALHEGVLDVDEFLDLNEGMGGYDRDGLVQEERAVGDPEGIRRAYESGVIVNGTGGLAHTPVIDLRNWNDGVADIHTSFWSVAVHERLVRDGVDPRLHVRWVFEGAEQHLQAFDLMDRWLTAIGDDHGPGTPAEKAVRNRPAEASEGCWPEIGGPKVDDLAACYAGPFPYSGDLRTVAGAPITSDVTCQLAAPDPADYEVAFTPAQWEQLLDAFPEGVCDWSQPGLQQVPIAGTWQAYGTG